MTFKIMEPQTLMHSGPLTSARLLTIKSPLENYFASFRKNIIGQQQTFQSPFGNKQIIYADWTASGRAYRLIEELLQSEIMPFAANTHTEATITGSMMSKAYKTAKQVIKQHVNAGDGDILLFCGSGMTAAVSKLQRILGMRLPERITDYVKDGSSFEIDELLRPVVFVTHMEHHSNHISWLETIANVEIIDPDEYGNVDLKHLKHLLDRYKYRKNKIAAVTACSNVTGIETPYHEIAKLMHKYGGLCFVDFATSAPYGGMNMHPEEKGACMDAIYFSPHKFLGGPGTPGVLIFNKKLYKNNIPDEPGGGTIAYSNPWKTYQYINDVENREDGGTPPFLQGIKAAMCIRLKEKMGIENMRQREDELLKYIFERFAAISNVDVLAGNNKKRFGVVSFIVKGAHYNLIVKLLDDRFGIQTRGGCSCAGTYGHLLLHVNEARSLEILDSISSGNLQDKPGWVRLSTHPVMTDAEIAFIMDAIESTALHFEVWSKDYTYYAGNNEYVFNGNETANQEGVERWFNVMNWKKPAPVDLIVDRFM